MVERDSFELSEEVINKYIVEIALREWSGLRRLGRMTWTAGDAQDDVSRIDLRRAMISLLQEAGRPLQTHEIRQRLVALRGINEHFHIATMDPVLRVGVGLWGLNDRDIAIKRPNQPQLLDELIAMLEDREIGIHVSELGRWSLTLDSALSVQTLFSLAHGDNRLKISPAQNLYLAEWGGSRRESMREAAIAVLTSSTQPLVLADIRLQVEKRIRRMCDRRSLIRCLRALEADADPSTETWSFNLKPPPADEDPVLVARQDLADGGDR